MPDSQGRADLHVHTLFSDGALTPEQVIQAAWRAGLRAIAITDHDAVGGIELAASPARDLGIDVIPGVELSVTHKGHDFHLLAYFIDARNNYLLERLRHFRRVRAERARRMAKKLRAMGLPIEDAELSGVVGYGAVGRAHIATVLLNKGLVSSFGEAFGRYIGDRAPAYVPKYKMSFQEAVNLVRRAGGVVVWAHPGVDGRDELLPQFVALGLQGLEVLHPDHTYAQQVRYRKLAKRWDLVATGGSDCHGAFKRTPTIGSAAVDYSVVEELRSLARRARGQISAAAVARDNL